MYISIPKRKFAGTKWDVNEKILKSVYQGNVQPHLEYGSSSWMTASNIHHQTLDMDDSSQDSPSDLRHG